VALINELLKYSKEQSQAVIVILIGLIIIGTISGGLWIQNLRSDLSEKEALQEERLKLTEERYRNSFADVATRFLTLEDIVKNLETTVYSYKDNLDQIANEIKDIVLSREINLEKRNKLISLSNNISNYTVQIMRGIEETKSSLNWDSRVLRRLARYREPPPMAGNGEEIVIIMLFFFLILTVLMLILIIIVMKIRYKRKLKKI